MILYLKERIASCNMVQSKLCLAVLAFFGTVSAQTILDLGDETWTVTDQSNSITVPGKWPSQVHLDLYAAGIIGEFIDNSHSLFSRFRSHTNFG
jgi:hypothetical protein